MPSHLDNVPALPAGPAVLLAAAPATVAEAPAANSPRKLLLVDDHPILRQGLAQVINRQPGLQVCGEAETGPEAMALIERTSPDLVLIDLSLRSGDGIELVKDVKARFGAVPMLILSMHDEFVYAERALRAGARGYVMKQERVDQLLEAIGRVLGGGIYVSAKLAEKMVDQFVGGPREAIGLAVDRLTDRELQVFRLIGQGLGTRLIAENLGLSRKTIESHREHIKEKLRLRNGDELIQRAIQWMKDAGLPANGG